MTRFRGCWLLWPRHPWRQRACQESATGPIFAPGLQGQREQKPFSPESEATSLGSFSSVQDLAAGRGAAAGDFNPLKSSQKLRINSKIAIGESNQYGSTGLAKPGKRR